MTRPRTNSPRGLISKDTFFAGAGGLFFSPYSTTAALLDSDSTGVVLAGGMKISNQANGLVQANSTGVRFTGQVRVQDARYIGANTTGYLFTAQAAKPTTRTAGYRWSFIQNTTGVCGIAINTTGTTWKFANVTAVLPS